MNDIRTILTKQGELMGSFKKYTHSIVIFMLGLLFLTFPILAGLLLGGGLIVISMVYARLIYRWNKYMEDAQRVHSSFENRVFESGGPSFRNVTVAVFNKY
jgi:hypothetical protein